MAKVNFTYKSIGNFVKLLCTISYEKKHSGRDIVIWHNRFDDEKSDELFESFLRELFPDGRTITEEDISVITERAHKYLLEDEISKDFAVTYDKSAYESWVYFKPDKRVIPCGFGRHTETVQKVLLDFFKGFEPEDINRDMLERFIQQNFEVRSGNTTVKDVAKNSEFFYKDIIQNL